MPSIPAGQFEDWTQRLRASDEEAGNELFRAMYPSLRRYAVQLVGSRSLAEDVVQEAFLRIWRGREKLDTSGSLRGLLFTIVRNLAINEMGRTRKHDTLSEDLLPVAAAEDARISEATLAYEMERWIFEMPLRRREAFVLSRFAGLGYSEIARIMGLSIKTVERHMQLALEHLRKRIRAYDPDLLKE